MNFVLPYLSKVPNTLIRAELMADIAQKLDVNQGVIGDSFQKATMGRREALPLTGGPEGGRPSATSGSVAKVGVLSERLPAAEAMLIRLLLESEESRVQVLEQLHEQELVSEMEGATIIAELVASRGAGEPLDYVLLSERLDPARQRMLAEITFDPEARPVTYGEISVYLNALSASGCSSSASSCCSPSARARKPG